MDEIHLISRFAKDVEIEVDNVLVSPTSADVVNDKYHRKKDYTLAIPKGDTNNWEDTGDFFQSKRYEHSSIPRGIII